MKFKVIALALCFSLSASAATPNYKPRLPRTFQGYVNGCALQYKLFGLMAYGIKKGSETHINGAMATLIENHHPEDQVIEVYKNMLNSPESLDSLMSIIPDRVKYSTSPVFKALVNRCASHPEEELLNYKDGYTKGAM